MKPASSSWGVGAVEGCRLRNTGLAVSVEKSLQEEMKSAEFLLLLFSLQSLPGQ